MPRSDRQVPLIHLGLKWVIGGRFLDLEQSVQKIPDGNCNFLLRRAGSLQRELGRPDISIQSPPSLSLSLSNSPTGTSHWPRITRPEGSGRLSVWMAGWKGEVDLEVGNREKVARDAPRPLFPPHLPRSTQLSPTNAPLAHSTQPSLGWESLQEDRDQVPTATS